MNFKLTNSSSLQFFQLLRYLTFVLIGVVFTKTNLSVSEIGTYEQFLFISGAVSFFWLNGLVRGMLVLSKSKGLKDGDILFNSFFLISLLTLLAVLFLYLLNGVSVAASVSKLQVRYLYLLLAYLFFSVPANLTEHFFLIRNQSVRIVNYGAVSFFVLFLLTSIPALLGHPIVVSLYGLVASAVLRYLYLVYLLIRNSSFRFSVSFLREHWVFSFPLILSALLSGSAQYVDGFIVTSYFDEATFAVFRYGARELPLVLLLANAFSSAMLPEFSVKKDLLPLLQRIKQESQKMSHYLFPLSALLVLSSHVLFPFVFNKSFSESASVFNIYLLLISSRLLFPQTILIGLKKTMVIAWASFFELALNVLLSFWFVGFWGIQGVAYATVVAYLFEKFFLMFVLRRRLNIRVTNYQNISLHLFYSLLLFILFCMVEFVIY